MVSDHEMTVMGWLQVQRDKSLKGGPFPLHCIKGKNWCWERLHCLLFSVCLRLRCVHTKQTLTKGSQEVFGQQMNQQGILEAFQWAREARACCMSFSLTISPQFHWGSITPSCRSPGCKVQPAKCWILLQIHCDPMSYTRSYEIFCGAGGDITMDFSQPCFIVYFRIFFFFFFFFLFPPLPSPFLLSLPLPRKSFFLEWFKSIYNNFTQSPGPNFIYLWDIKRGCLFFHLNQICTVSIATPTLHSSNCWTDRKCLTLWSAQSEFFRINTKIIALHDIDRLHLLAKDGTDFLIYFVKNNLPKYVAY